MRNHGLALNKGDPAGYGQCLFNMKIPEISFLIFSSIIVYAIRHIRILLNFRYYNFFSDSMNRTCLNKQHIPFLNRYFIEHFQESIFTDSLTEFLFINLSGKSIVQESSFLAIYNIPHFRLLVLALIFQSIAIVRVDLN